MIELDHFIVWIATSLTVKEGITVVGAVGAVVGAVVEAGSVHALQFPAERIPIVRHTTRALTRLQDERRFVREIQGFPTRVGIGT